MPKRDPKETQKMNENMPLKNAKICLKGALGIPTKMISKVFIDSTVFLKKM